MNLLLVGSEEAFRSYAAERFLDGLHLHVVARASTLAEAAACLDSGMIDLFLLSSEFQEEWLSLFARDARCRGFSGLILRAADMPRALSESDSHELNTMRIGDFVIDIATRQIWVRGIEISCTPKEFELLRFFCRNPERPISHKALLQALWGNPAASPHILRVLVRALRAKIETTIRPRYIVTKRQFGYRFIPSSQPSP
jgi:DNA-binding winged helix-turn-helix (wHTH) protein